ncbi:hypothetical protein OPV22_017231 [Ensete ventricosum]|uniref:Uncharacterized protein n=1 Tax=Ensete ventricosum TaxID=4639 RepID=A0AAV8PHJ5_ENSVE|nr:hypothetical protein OPV22_017231 [Ensete ventricosum]
MGGGVFALLGFKKQQRRSHESAARPGHRQKRHEAEQSRPRQLSRKSYEEEMEPWQRKVRRTDEDHGRWISGLDVDRKAEEFIDRIHKKLNPDHCLEVM